MMEINNLVSGEEYASSRFENQSRFYPDVSYEVPDASSMDVDYAISAARNAVPEMRETSLDERAEMLERASAKLDFTDDMTDYAIHTMGMPRKSMEDFISQIPGMIRWMPEQFRARYPESEGRYLVNEIEETDQIEAREPVDGFAYSVVPGNDPRAGAFVTSVLASAGVPAVLKVSKDEMPFSLELARKLQDAGYPEDALNLVCWDTEDEERSFSLNSQIAREAKVVMPFGSDQTVNQRLRYHSGQDNFAPRRDNGIVEDKVIIPHPSGRCAAILDGEYPEESMDEIEHGTFHYPISCKATKALYVVGDAEPVTQELVERAEDLQVGDPLDGDTDVGYIDPDLLDEAVPGMETRERHGSIDIRAGERVSEVQTTPYVVDTPDKLSAGLCQETSMYLLTVKEADSLEHAVDLCNEATEEGMENFAERKRLNVSVFTDRELDGVRPELLGLQAYHRKFNVSTFGEKDFAMHQGNDYARLLTRPSSISW